MMRGNAVTLIFIRGYLEIRSNCCSWSIRQWSESYSLFRSG